MSSFRHGSSASLALAISHPAQLVRIERRAIQDPRPRFRRLGPCPCRVPHGKTLNETSRARLYGARVQAISSAAGL
ncbi:hypothetical protein J3F84DRAFT_384924 [Trichoderma pleuroticola]